MAKVWEKLNNDVHYPLRIIILSLQSSCGKSQPNASWNELFLKMLFTLYLKRRIFTTFCFPSFSFTPQSRQEIGALAIEIAALAIVSCMAHELDVNQLHVYVEFHKTLPNLWCILNDPAVYTLGECQFICPSILSASHRVPAHTFMRLNCQNI